VRIGHTDSTVGASPDLQVTTTLRQLGVLPAPTDLLTFDDEQQSRFG